MNRLFAFSAIVGAFTVVSGCSDTSSPPAKDQMSAHAANGSSASAPVTKKGTVGMTVMNLTNEFFIVIYNNLKAELAQHGYEVLVFSAEEDAAKQKDQVMDFITQEVAAIVINPKDSKAIGPAIVEANEKDIPVFTVDVRCLDDSAKVVCHVGTDNYGGGKLAGEGMIEALGEAGGKIAVLDHKMVESCIERVRGFHKVVDAHNKGRTQGRIEIVTTLPSGGSHDVGYRSAQDALQQFPGLVGIFSINDPSVLGARAALEAAGKPGQVKLIGFDGQPSAKRAIRDGKIYADPIQYPSKMGVMVGQQIVAYFAGKDVPRSIEIATSLYRQADAKQDPTLD